MSRYVKTVSSSGRRYFYFTPPAKLAAEGLRGRPLGQDELAAHRNAAALIQAWERGQPQRLDRLEKRRQQDLSALVQTLFDATRKRARQRKIAFGLTCDGLAEMLCRQEWRCAITGLRFETRSIAGAKAFRDPFRPSVDRIDPPRGYIDGNCRLVCTAVNFAIGEWGEEIFFAIAEAAVARRRERTGNGFRKTKVENRGPKIR